MRSESLTGQWFIKGCADPIVPARNMMVASPMSWLLVIQPDPAQAEVLREALRGQISDDVVVVESIDDALSWIDERVPDVILVPSLIPIAVEDYLLAYLGAIPGAGHVQILGLPRLARPVVVQPPKRRSWFSWRRRPTPPVIPLPGRDPASFTQDVIDYLEAARALKRHLELNGNYLTYEEILERRREPRYAGFEVPWITLVKFGRERADLINVSSSGVLVRTNMRPDHRLLKRADQELNVRQRSRLTIELEQSREVHAMGRVIRCIPTRTTTRTQYEIAFSFDGAVGLHLPTSGALIRTKREPWEKEPRYVVSSR